MTEDSSSPRRRLSRRALLGAAGGVGVAGAAAFVGWDQLSGSSTSPSTAEATEAIVPFYGEHQAGIATPAQANLHFAAFDVTTSSRDELAKMLQE